MKYFNSLVIIILAYSSLFSQKAVIWSDLNKNPNILDINTYIRFSKDAELQNSSGSKLFYLKENDIIQIVKTDDFARIFFKDSVSKIKINLEQFELKFDGIKKVFKFIGIENEDNKPNNLSKSNITLSTPYYNALLIYNYRKKGDNCVVNQILDNLNIKVDTDNQFLLDLRQECNKESPSSTKIFKVNNNNILASLGGLDVTKYADGLAKFLVKRTKEELTISFFDKFKSEFNTKPDVKKLFPKTSEILDRIDEIYDYSRYLNLLRESYQNDFNNLPENVEELILGKNDTEIDPKYKLGVQISSKIIQGLRDKSHPGKILSSIDASRFELLHPDFKNCFIFSQILSESLRDTFSGANTPYWIDGSKILELSQNNELLNIFIGLTIEDLRTKQTDLFIRLNDITIVNSVIPFISEFSQLTQGVSSLIKLNHDERNINQEDIFKYIDYSLKIFQVSKKLLSGFNLTNQCTYNLDMVLSVLEVTNSIYANIATKKYSSAIFDLLELIELIPNLNQDNKIDWFMKYGSFMAETIAAENSDEVAKVIETYAMPNGSSRVKRNSNFNISLNSYLGLYGGMEDGKSVFGIAAPVGIAFSHGWEKGSISLYITAIDIGAISTFRFNNEEDDVAKIYLREIISPGAFISYGFKQSPFSLNLGFQRAPLLKRVGSSQNEVDLEHNTRVSLSFLVDIPLLNVYNKTKK